MPIYEYECTCCSSRFELKKSYHENTPVTCPNCECKAQRIFSPVPIIFKGSGFYSTDNRDNTDGSSYKAGADEVKAGADEVKAGADEVKAGSTEESS